MFKFAIAAILALATPAQAQTSLCPTLGTLAGTIMQARQAGLSEYQVRSVFTPGPLYDISMSMTSLAFKTPMYPTAQMRESAVDSFHNQVEYICYKN